MTVEESLLKRAVNEIKSLRTQNNLMKARLDMFDDCVALLSANVQRQGGLMSPDLVWEIEMALENKQPISTNVDTTSQ